MKINSCDNHVLYERHYVSVSESDESSPYDTRGKDGFFDLIGAISLEGLLMPFPDIGDNEGGGIEFDGETRGIKDGGGISL